MLKCEACSSRDTAEGRLGESIAELQAMVCARKKHIFNALFVSLVRMMPPRKSPDNLWEGSRPSARSLYSGGTSWALWLQAAALAHSLQNHGKTLERSLQHLPERPASPPAPQI